MRKPTGTLVQWSRCDRLDHRKANTIADKLRRPLGQRFRHYLWKGNRILINEELVAPFDPLHLTVDEPTVAARPFGDQLTFEFRCPSESARTSTVRVRFSELPIAQWYALSSEAKRALGVSKGAGVSIVRADREIDYGWYFMGAKRKENYDDWWRGEISFDPELDELFGVTHSKQEINLVDLLRLELSAHLEAIAQTLNSRARAAFMLVRKQEDRDPSRAEAKAAVRPPPAPGLAGSRWVPSGVRAQPPLLTKSGPTGRESESSGQGEAGRGDVGARARSIEHSRGAAGRRKSLRERRKRRNAGSSHSRRRALTSGSVGILRPKGAPRAEPSSNFFSSCDSAQEQVAWSY